MIRAAVAITMLTISVAIYMLWPHHSLKQLVNAMESGDVAMISRKIEWNEFRASIKEMVGTEFQRSFMDKAASSDANDQMASGLAAMIGPAVIEKMVDSMVTPAAFATLLANQRAATPDANGRFALKDGVLKGTSFAGPTRFEVLVGKPEDSDPTFLGVFELRDFDWKLTQVLALKPFDFPK